MAAGGDFTLHPELVVTLEPQYYNIITPSESQKKEYMNISATPIERFQLFFKALTDTDRDTLIAHYKDNYGGYHSFPWKSVPTYINSGANKTGRWVDGSLKMDPTHKEYWKCSIIFETDT